MTLDIEAEYLPMRLLKQGKKWAPTSERCVPTDHKHKRPSAWRPATCACARHKEASTIGHMAALFGPLPVDSSLRELLRAPGDTPMHSSWERATYSLMMLMIREPHTFLWPLREP